jgi:hypothetical protein
MMLANTKESFKISKDITHELSRTPLSLDGVFHHRLCNKCTMINNAKIACLIDVKPN